MADNFNIIFFQLENGAEPRLLNNGGQTAEAIACIRRNYQLAKLLSYWKGILA